MSTLLNVKEVEAKIETDGMRKSDKWIPWYFVLFFVVLALLDGTFVYLAVSSHTGVVTEQAYEKGLAYNDLLQRAEEQAQTALKQKVLYSQENGILRWTLHDKNGAPLEQAVVTAHIIRPVQDGYDFDIVLLHKGEGVYEVPVKTPLIGQWVAKLEAQWDTHRYQITHQFVVR